jgi:hypothetical protein
VGLLSHVSTFGLLLATLLATALFYRWLGGPPLRRPARSVFLAATIAAVVSVAAYYGHFGDAYRTLERTRTVSSASPTPGGAPPDGSVEAGAATPAPPTASTPRHLRAANAFVQGATDLGWPIVILAIVGAWRVWVDRARDRVTFAVCAWGVAYFAFLIFGVIAPVNLGYERYAAEFIGRVDLATYPAAIVLAARGAAWAWRVGTVGRVASTGLCFSAVVIGAQYWARWLE